MKKPKKQTKTWTLKQQQKWEQALIEARSDSALWKVMMQDTSMTMEERDNLYRRTYCLLNLCYMLSDVQDWCARDVQDIISRFKMNVAREHKRNYTQILKATERLIYLTGINYKRVEKSGEAMSYITGCSDLFYDTLRMLMDRMAKKRDVHHFIHLLRTIPNHNLVWPELDKGRYHIDV